MPHSLHNNTVLYRFYNVGKTLVLLNNNCSIELLHNITIAKSLEVPFFVTKYAQITFDFWQSFPGCTHTHVHTPIWR